MAASVAWIDDGDMVDPNCLRVRHRGAGWKALRQARQERAADRCSKPYAQGTDADAFQDGPTGRTARSVGCAGRW